MACDVILEAGFADAVSMVSRCLLAGRGLRAKSTSWIHDSTTVVTVGRSGQGFACVEHIDTSGLDLLCTSYTRDDSETGRTQADFSAFGAAHAFVSLVGVQAARRAALPTMPRAPSRGTRRRVGLVVASTGDR